MYTDPLAWKLRKQGRWARSAWRDHWRSIQHTDKRHPDNSEYRTLSLGNVKVLRNVTHKLLSGRGGGDGGGGGGAGVGAAGSASAYLPARDWAVRLATGIVTLLMHSVFVLCICYMCI